MPQSTLRRSSRHPWLVLALPAVLAGCGPTAIGVGLSSIGGGGGGPEAPTASAQQTEYGPAETLLAWICRQGNGRPVRFWLEFEYLPERPLATACDRAGVIPAAHLEFVGVVPAAAENDRYVGLTSKDGVTYTVVWKHAAHLGQREARGVSVRLRYVDDQGATSEQSPLTLVDHQVVGREPPRLTALDLVRDGGDEGALVVSFGFEDQGDTAPNRWEVQYDYTLGGPPNTAAATPTLNRRRLTDACAAVYDGTVRLDPIDLDMPSGTFAEFTIRLRCAQDGDGFSEWLERSFRVVIGIPPAISDVTVPDPLSNQTSLGEPRFQLPIRFRVTSRSRRAQRVLFQGHYDVNNGAQKAMTLARTGEAGTASIIDLAAGDSRIHYLIWNVVADEGIGIRLEDNLVSEVFLTPHVLDDRAPAGLAGPQVGSGLRQTRLYTVPFVDHQILLREPAARLVSAAVQLTPRTRDIFFTQLVRRRPPNLPQLAEWVIGTDQTFAAIRIPGLPTYNIDSDFNVNQGFIGLFPLDVVPDRPDCIARIAQNEDPLFHFVWREPNTAPEITRIAFPSGRTGGQRSGGGRVEIAIDAGGGRVLRGVCFHGYDDLPPRSGKNPPNHDPADIHLIGLVFNEQATPRWRATSHEFPPPELPRRNIPGTLGRGQHDPRRTAGYEFVAGDLDGDRATQEIFIGFRGIEFQTTEAPGWFDLFQVRPRLPEGDLDFVLLPRTVPLPPNPEPLRDLDEWRLCPWPNPDDATRPGLLLARTFQAGGGQPRVHSFHVLRQVGSGGFQGSSWQHLGDLPDTSERGIDQLHACAVDLDGSVGGTREPELVVMLQSVQPAPPNLLDVVIGTRADRPPVVFRTALRRKMPIRASAEQFGGGTIVDVNGDDFPDLVVREDDATSAEDRGFTYFASALTGVAGGLSLVAQTASNSPSRQPSVGDFNGDGYADVLSAGVLHRGEPDGTYLQDTGGFGPGSATATYLVQKVLAAGAADPQAQDVVVHDPSGSSLVQPYAVEGGIVRTRSEDARAILSPLPIRAVAPFVRPAMQAGDDKQLAVVGGDGAQDNTLFLHRLSGAEFRGDPWPGFSARILPQVAALRLGELAAGSDPSRIDQLQSVVVGLAGTNRIAVLATGGGYGATTIEVGGSEERVARLAVGSVTEDALEDVLVLTTESPNLIRLWCLPQQAGGGLGTPLLFLQFDEWAIDEIRGLGFDSARRSLAQGILIARTGVRIVLPVAEGSGTRAAMIRSPLDASQFIDGMSFGLQITDLDRDGQIEVLGGEQVGGGAWRLRKIDRAYRRP